MGTYIFDVYLLMANTHFARLHTNCLDNILGLNWPPQELRLKLFTNCLIPMAWPCGLIKLGYDQSSTHQVAPKVTLFSHAFLCMEVLRYCNSIGKSFPHFKSITARGYLAVPKDKYLIYYNNYWHFGGINLQLQYYYCEVVTR